MTLSRVVSRDGWYSEGTKVSAPPLKRVSNLTIFEASGTKYLVINRDFGPYMSHDL
jgi:hypothetical protein